MGNVTFGGPLTTTYLVLNIVFCTLGFFATLINILILRKMNYKIGLLALLYFMNCCQLVNVFFLFGSNVYCGYYISGISNVFEIIFGFASGLVTNWISFIAFYILYYRRAFDINYHLRTIYTTCLVPGIIVSIIYLSALPTDNNLLQTVTLIYIFANFRLVSIFVNFLIGFLNIIRVRNMISKKGNKSPEELAIRALAIRLMYYPIIQAIARCGKSWYELDYGKDIDNADDTSETQYSAMLLMAILTPMISLGYLIIFIVMQPNAYQTFLSMLGIESKEPTRSISSSTPRISYSDHNEAIENTPQTLTSASFSPNRQQSRDSEASDIMDFWNYSQNSENYDFFDNNDLMNMIETSDKRSSLSVNPNSPKRSSLSKRNDSSKQELPEIIENPIIEESQL